MTADSDQRRMLLNEIGKCRACRFCVDVCPTYQATGGLETWSSFGRLQTLRHLLIGRLPMDDAFVKTLYTCLQCRRCERVCKAKGQNIDICTIIHQGRVLISKGIVSGGENGEI